MGVRLYGRGYSMGLGTAMWVMPMVWLGKLILLCCIFGVLVYWWMILVIVGGVWAGINTVRGVSPAWPIKQSLWGFQIFRIGR